MTAYHLRLWTDQTIIQCLTSLFNISAVTFSRSRSHHPQDVLLAHISLYVHKGSLKPNSFHFKGEKQSWKLSLCSIKFQDIRFTMGCTISHSMNSILKLMYYIYIHIYYIIHWISYPLEVVSRYLDPQLQVGKNIYICTIWIQAYADPASLKLLSASNVLVSWRKKEDKWL